MKRLVALGLATLVLAAGGCAGIPAGADTGFAVEQSEPQRAAALAADLMALAEQSPDIRREAELIARTALRRTADLREQFRPVSIPLLNNLLVNLHWRRRGLCYQWTNDLLDSLEALALGRFTLHWGNAFWGNAAREHNVVVVTARGAGFPDGLVLDAWRRAGKLVWLPVKLDRDYAWRKLSVEELRRYRPATRAD